MVAKIRECFTKWYVKQGYTFGYNFYGIPIVSDDVFKIPCGMPKACFSCPLWVKPLLIFFSPSVYTRETIGRNIAEGFMIGIDLAINYQKEPTNNA